MTPLPPWADGPFELLVHAEGHLRKGEDFDRRMALIGFDNAIEVAITTYLSLHPVQRGNRKYDSKEVEKWLNNYHTKLDFLAVEILDRKSDWRVERSHVVWAHDHRNEQYHGGNKGTPEKKCLSIVRKSALWIFGLLFDVPDVEERLLQAVAEAAPPAPMQRDQGCDRAIDNEYGMIEIGEQHFYASEVLFSVDYWAYRDVGNRLSQRTIRPDGEEPKE